MRVTLPEFLRACLDEKQRVAEAAQPDVWYRYFRNVVALRNPQADVSVVSDRDLLLASDEPDEDWDEREDVFTAATKADAIFVSENSPRRVLAEIAAMRAILDLHAPAPMQSVSPQWYPDTPEQECTVCHRGLYRELWPCRTVRLLAQPFGDRPGWSPDWDWSPDWEVKG